MAVVGATGAVGNQIVDLIAARGFPARELETVRDRSGRDRRPSKPRRGAAGRCVSRIRPTSRLRHRVPRASPASRARLEIIARAARSDSDRSERVRIARRIRRADGRARIDLARALARFARRKRVRDSASRRARARHRLNALGAQRWIRRRDRDARRERRRHGTCSTVTVDQTTDLLSARLDLEEDETQRALQRLHARARRSVAAQSPRKPRCCSARRRARRVQVAADSRASRLGDDGRYSPPRDRRDIGSASAARRARHPDCAKKASRSA